MCVCDFSVALGRLYDVTRHGKGKFDLAKARVVSGDVSISFVPSVSGTLAIQVLSAEIAISNFFAQDYLPCLAADHLSDL